MDFSPVVQTAYGPVRGLRGNDVYVWRSIPYARPPVGTLRFQPPQPPEPWSTVRDATEFGPRCAQVPFALEQMLGSKPVPESEDCLTLNIWSTGMNDARRPVLFWIHGGAFINGSGSTPWYDGTAFAQGGAVVVTINYRLGPLGFLALDTLGGDRYAGSGNAGLLDQVAALRWVRENIAAFGGDPQNITIFGESAGAMSIGTLMGMPQARGLFHKAILESGAAESVADRETATRIASALLKELGLSPERVEALHDVPVAAILDAAIRVSALEPGLLAFRPVVDGTVLPQPPMAAVRAGSARDVSMLIGTNRDEMNLFTAFDPQLAQLSEDDLLARCAELVGTDAAPRLLAAYGELLPESAPIQRWNAISTDSVFRMPAIHLAEAQAKLGAPIWMYRFDWPSPIFGGRLGACHALELPFVWQTLDQPGANALTGTGTDREPIARRMNAAWLAFARSGNPAIADLPTWPQYDEQRRATLTFNQQDHLIDDPQRTTRLAWNEMRA